MPQPRAPENAAERQSGRQGLLQAAMPRGDTKPGEIQDVKTGDGSVWVAMSR